MADILKTDLAYTGQRVSVKRKFMSFEDGHRETWEFIEMGEGVSVLPIDSDGFIYLLNEYTLAEENQMFLPAKGLVDDGETPDMAASREMKEEMGLQSTNFIKLGTFYALPSYSNARTTIYLAENVTPCEKLKGDEHHPLDVIYLPFSEALQMLEHGQIKSALTANALLLAKMHFDKQK